MNHDMTRSAIELGPFDGDRFDDAPGEQCAACRGHGGDEDHRGEWHDCNRCDGTGVAP